MCVKVWEGFKEDLGFKNYFVALLALVHKGKHWLKGEEIKMIRSFKASQMVDSLFSIDERLRVDNKGSGHLRDCVQLE